MGVTRCHIVAVANRSSPSVMSLHVNNMGVMPKSAAAWEEATPYFFAL